MSRVVRSKSAVIRLGVVLWWILAGFTAQGAVELSETGQPEVHAFSFEPAAITGFGGITFGMSVEEVKATLSEMYPEGEVQHTFEPVQETQVLSLTVPHLAPVPGAASPGPASVTYVFGYQSERLMAINLNWYVLGDATPAEREAMLAAGTAYVADLLGYAWEPFTTSRGVVVGLHAVLLFAGRDLLDRGVEVLVEGVPLDVVVLPEGRSEHRPIASGPVHLRIGLAARPDNPDVFTIPAGSF